MALHWQHIKGVYGEEPLYTYIEFAPKPTGSNLKKQESIPDLYVSISNYSDKTEIKNNAKYLGKFIVSDAEDQSINSNFSFLKQINCNDTVNFYRTIYRTNENNKNTWVKFIDNTTPTSPVDKFCIYNALKISTPYTVFKMMQNAGRMAIEASGKDYILDIGDDGITSNRTLTMSSSNKIICGSGNQTIIDSTKVEAPYFNATSDRRAKEDPLPFSGKALDIINQIQTFTYKYKDTKQVSYGVMAQDLLDIKINDFSFVENAAATGENGDYMSVRESKLVYLLLEGIKELQIEVNNLRKEVEKLKNGK